ncbi:hypothetical protein GOP47_0018380 [Adiantum capillus-veneris]|uniref:Uncharacterized protein n=1 Tax=Adiantum capillus-veneris TaxID=13818 RepID=A0A9D4ZAM6_ADICA|nr:hypothetical protein GOP47_0018380 [Adiantum capillus-veneris]
MDIPKAPLSMAYQLSITSKALFLANASGSANMPTADLLTKGILGSKVVAQRSIIGDGRSSQGSHLAGVPLLSKIRNAAEVVPRPHDSLAEEGGGRVLECVAFL